LPLLLPKKNSALRIVKRAFLWIFCPFKSILTAEWMWTALWIENQGAHWGLSLVWHFQFQLRRINWYFNLNKLFLTYYSLLRNGDLTEATASAESFLVVTIVSSGVVISTSVLHHCRRSLPKHHPHWAPWARNARRLELQRRPEAREYLDAALA